MDLTQITNAALLQRMTKLDARVNDDDDPADELAEELDLTEQELNRRFGTDALDVLASYWTASHAAPEDRIQDAEEMPEVLVEIAKGVHVHRSSTVRNGNCLCGVLPEFFQSPSALPGGKRNL